VSDASIDDATSQFLEAAAEDLQRQLGIAGDVEMIWTGRSAAGIGLLARIRIHRRTIEVSGVGDNLLDAYADLRQQVAEPTLATAFLEVVDR
jgi:hypothetical protein